MAKKTAHQLLHIRIPKELHRKLQREADRRGQTLNAEILVRLDQSFEIMGRLDAINAMIQETWDKIGMTDEELGEIDKKLAEEANEAARKPSDTGPTKHKPSGILGGAKRHKQGESS